MANPTLEDDLAFVRRKLCTCPSCSSALDRIAAALKDREHLEEGSRLLRSNQVPFEKVNFHEYSSRYHDWITAERARKQTTKSPNAGT